MKVQPLPPADANVEIHALIEVLHKTERRLAQLTGNEVDSVSDGEGGTLLLRHAQESWRRNEAAKQAAILNALPAHVALLGPDGSILSVNAAWRRFARANGLQSPDYGVGVNYLTVCDAVRGLSEVEANRVAKGIRSVLAGRVTSFSIPYSCHSPTEQRWFVLTATALTRGRLNGAVVRHQDVTAERQTEESLHVSESRFRQMAENIRDVFFLQNLNSSQIFYVSPAYEQIWGRTCDSLYANPTSWADSIHPEDASRIKPDEGPTARVDDEFRIIRPDGAVRWVHVRKYSVLDETGKPYRIAGIVADITARKETEHRLRHLNRIYAVLSAINSTLVRVRDRNELFKETCRIAVEAGAFKMAWIGVVDPQTQEGKVVASYGAKQGYTDDIGFTQRGIKPGTEGPASRALRLLQPVVCNDIATDDSIARHRSKLLRGGFKAFACLSVTIAGQPEAVIVLFASVAHAFDEEEMRLLTQLSDDISFALDHLEKAAKLAYVDYYDVLTGLANRRQFLEQAAQHMRGATAKGHKIALCLLDLERFKNINDTFGRAAGDALLKQLTEWLKNNFRGVDFLGRAGADQFAIVLPEVKHAEDVARLIGRSMEAFLKHPFKLNDRTFRVAARVGIALFPDDGTRADVVYANAEAALKKAKLSGDRILFYTQTMTETVSVRLTLEFQLRHALENQEFVLHYQPKVHLATGKLTGAEALIRWNDPRTGLVPPGRFIPILETTGLIFEVGRWALRQAIEDYVRWRAAGLPAVRIAVNVSPLQLRNRGFITEIRDTIGSAERTAAGLELELTESLVMEDIERSITTLQAVRAMGVRIAIDDFGTGFSSLSILSKLPVDTLKIDRAFIVDMTVGDRGLSLVSAIINLGHSLKLNVVAEGVETDEQRQLLRSLSCDEMQGFLFGKAVPREEFERKHLAVEKGRFEAH